MGTDNHSFRRILLTTATIAIALSGCTTDQLLGPKNGSPARPVISATPLVDPMLATAPPSGAEGNGSQRVPFGQLAANTSAQAPASAAPATPGSPLLLVPASGSTQVNVDPMDASPPTVVAPVPPAAPPAAVAQAPQPAPKPEPPKPAATAPAPAPAEKAPAPAPKPELEKPSGPVTSTPQPETLQRMAAAKATKSAKSEAAPATQAAPAPLPVVAVAVPEPAKTEPALPAKAEPAPAAKPEPASVVAKAEPQPAPPPPQPAPQLKLNMPPLGAKPLRQLMSEPPPDTVVISSSSTTPVKDTREFIPATLMASAAPATMSDAPGAMLSRPLSAAEKNVAQRFEVLRALLEENLITPDEYVHHRNANLGALLPYTREPAAVGLERPAPSADAVVARLEALRRSLEMRAISTKQHAMERSMILNALLPEAPMDRMPEMAPPEDIIQATTLVSHLQTLRNRGLVNAEEFDGERKAIESYLKTGKLPASPVRAADAARTAQTAAAKQAEAAKAAEDKEKKDQAAAKSAEDELTSPVPGPVLHLASFRTRDAANKGWQEALDRNKALLGSVKEIVRKVDLGQQRGVFYRLMAGPYPTLAAAETACIALKQNNQFCRASADGS